MVASVDYGITYPSKPLSVRTLVRKFVLSCIVYRYDFSEHCTQSPSPIYIVQHQSAQHQFRPLWFSRSTLTPCFLSLSAVPYTLFISASHVCPRIRSSRHQPLHYTLTRLGKNVDRPYRIRHNQATRAMPATLTHADRCVHYDSGPKFNQRAGWVSE